MGKRKTIVLLLIALLSSACEKEEEIGEIRLKVATYNVHHMASGYHSVRKTIGLINPDIIALQEVLRKGSIDYSRRLAEDLKLHIASSRPYVIFSDRSWVLTFLSRYPVRNKEEIRLGKYRRGLKVRLDIRGRTASFATLHLSPFIWDSKNLVAANRRRIRDREKEMGDLISWFTRRGKPEVVLGDFNIPGITPGMGPLYDKGYMNVLDRVENSVRGTFRISSSVRKAAGRYYSLLLPDWICLDYILVSGTVKVVSASTFESRSSDHLPLVAEIELEKPGNEQ